MGEASLEFVRLNLKPATNIKNYRDFHLRTQEYSSQTYTMALQ